MSTTILGGVLVLAPSAANATASGALPGGGYAVDLADFQYPSAAGCFRTASSYVNVALQEADMDSFALNLTVRNGAGQTVGTISVNQTMPGRYPILQQFCLPADAPGIYTATGTLFVDLTGPYYQSVTAQVSESYILTAAPVTTTPTTTPQTPVTKPTRPKSKSCKAAQKALQKAKRQDKPFSVVQKAKKRVKKVC